MASTPKKTSTKTTVKKTAVKKPAAKKSVTKKTSVKTKATRSTKLRKVTPEEHYKMVEVAAYYIAEHHNFEGNATDFWAAAEQEINKKAA